MNNENSLGASGAPYEYTVKEAHSSALIFKRVTLIAIYALWVAGLVLAGVLLKAPVPMAAIALISVWVLYFFTWRLTQVEYEYSFFAGTLTVCRVLGGRARRVLTEANLRALSSVYPCDEEHMPRIEAYGAECTLFAASSVESPTLYAAMWCDEDNIKSILYFEPNEKALSIMRRHNAAAVGLRKKSN